MTARLVQVVGPQPWVDRIAALLADAGLNVPVTRTEPCHMFDLTSERKAEL